MNRKLSLIAQDIVDATSIFVRTRTINIMDTNGIIIASSDHGRIGSWHEGASQVVSTGKTVEIRPEEVARYAGAKQGINSPIFQDGVIVGVVGIYGDPEEVRDTAALLSVCVGLYMKQAERTEKLGRRKESRRALFELLVSGGASSRIDQLWAMLGKELHYPYTPVLVITSDTALRDADCFFRQLVEKHLAEGRSDLVLECMDGYLLVCQKCDSSKMDAIAAMEGVAKVVKGNPLHAHGEAEDEIRALRMMAQSCRQKTADLAKADDLYLLNFVPDGSPFVAKAAMRYASRLKHMTGGWVEETVRACLACDGSPRELTRVLKVHKNTSLYRMHRIWEELGMEDARTESRMFFLRYACHLVTQEKEETFQA